MGLLIKGLLGALVVVLIGVLAKNQKLRYRWPGPAVSHLCAHRPLYCRQRAGIEALRATIVFGMWSILPYFIYLLSLWYFTGIMRLPLALAGAVGCWGLCARLLILGWSRFH